MDAGQKARAALSAQSIGELFRISCDILDIPITEVSRRSGVSMARIADIVSGSPFKGEESSALRTGVDSMIRLKKEATRG